MREIWVSGGLLIYSLIIGEVVQRREVLPCKTVPYFTFVIYIELGKRQSIGQHKVKRCLECEYVDLSVLVILI